VREIRTLRAMWRALETELRQFLYGHEEGNLGYKPRRSLRAPRQCSTLPGRYLASRRNNKASDEGVTPARTDAR
jgi:hypothetical protein